MTVGIPQTNNSSWRIKYDKVEKDAVTGQQSQKPADDFKEHKPEPPKMGGRKEFGKPAKSPAKPKAGNVPRLTGGKLEGLSNRIQQLRTTQDSKRTAGNIIRPQDTSRKTPTGQTESDKKIKPEFEKRRQSMRNTNRIMGKLRRQTQEHPRNELGIKDPTTGEKRTRDGKGGRHQRGKITPKPLKTTPEKVLEREAQSDDKTPSFGRDRGMPHPDKIPSSDNTTIQTNNPKRDQSAPNKKGKRPPATSRQTRGITSTQAGDKTTQQSRMKKPVQTSGQTAFRSRTIEDQALGRKDTDIEPTEEAKEKQRREAQSRSDRGVKEDKPETPKNIKVKRPEQAGTQHSFTKLTEKPTGQREKRPEQGVEGKQQLGSKEMQDRKPNKKIRDDDPNSPTYGEEYPEKEQSKTRFGSHFSQERENRVSGKEGKYNKLVEELRQAKQDKQGAETDAKVKEINTKIRDLESQVKRPKEEVDAEDKEEKKPLPKGVPERAVVKPDEVVENVGQPAKPKVEGKVRTSNETDVGNPKKDTTGHKEIMPKNPPKQRSGKMDYAHPPTKFERDTGKKDEDGNPIKETTGVPESLIHEKIVGSKRQFVLSGKDPETGITAKEVFDSTDGISDTSNTTDYDKERRQQRSDDPDEAPKRGKTVRTHSKYTVSQLKEWLDQKGQKIDMEDKEAINNKVNEMRRDMRKAVIQQAESRLKLIQLKSNL